MSGSDASAERQEAPPPPPPAPPEQPALYALVLDTRLDRLGVFCGEWAGYWFLRPVHGGREWRTDPTDVRPTSQQQRLAAGTAHANARSRGECL